MGAFNEKPSYKQTIPNPLFFLEKVATLQLRHGTHSFISFLNCETVFQEVAEGQCNYVSHNNVKYKIVDQKSEFDLCRGKI